MKSCRICKWKTHVTSLMLDNVCGAPLPPCIDATITWIDREIASDDDALECQLYEEDAFKVKLEAEK